MLQQSQLWPSIQISILFVLCFLSSSSYARVKPPPITLKPALKSEVSSLLKDMENVHAASTARSEAKLATSLSKAKAGIAKVRSKLNLAGQQQLHISRILDTAEKGIDRAKTRTGAGRRAGMADAFYQIVQLVRVYGFTDYKIYFCPKDKSTWFQRGKKPKNPVSPDKFLDCGNLAT